MTLQEIMDELEAERDRLLDALAKTAYVERLDFAFGRYYKCALCKGVSPHHVVVRAQVQHAPECVLFVETPQAEAMAAHDSQD